MISIACPQCGLMNVKQAGVVNRARKLGAPVYCGRRCAGLARRKPHVPESERKARKAEYDRAYRAKNLEARKAQKAEYHKRTYDPVKAAEHRKTRMAAHVEYCRRPEYRAKKKEYDRRHRAEKFYGEWAECFLLTQDIRNECLEQASDYEIRLAAGTLSKSQQRKRNYARTHSNQPETGSLGNAG